MHGEGITLPAQWQDWQIVRPLGHTNHSAVYELQRKNGAWQERVALKVVSIPQTNAEIQKLRSNGYDTQSIAELFQHRLTTIVNEYTHLHKSAVHRNILRWDEPVCIRHSDGIGWDIFLMSELSTSIAQHFRQNVPEDQVIMMARDLCRALIHCERKKIVHRDIRPGNIFISEDGHYKLGDFGAATVAEQLAPDTAVNHSYTAPEVYNGSPHTHAADIYALGLSMYWALNDLRLPFQTADAAAAPSQSDPAMLRRLDGGPLPDPARGSDELKKILKKACAADPKLRYASAGDMLEDLKTLNVFSSERQSITDQELRQLEQNAHLIRLTEAEAQRKKLERQLQEETRRQQEEAQRRQEEARRKQEAEQLRQKQEAARARLRKILIAAGAAAAMILVLLVGYFTIHFWSDAPCGEHPICRLCGKEQNTVTMHQWVDATSFAPKTCVLCGATEGSPLLSDPTTGSTEEPTVQEDDRNEIISLELGLDHTVALYEDGTVRAVGDNSRNQCATSEWRDIIRISAYYHHTVALRRDGTVYATGLNNYGQCNVSEWRDMVSVAAGCTHTVGLKSDGTVVAVGENKHGECDVSNWTDVVKIYAGWFNTVGMRSDGTILIAGLQGYGQADAKGWTDILELSTSDSHIVGLRSNGTAISVGTNKYGHCEVSGWTDLAQIHAGCAFTLGLKNDGTVVYIGITDENQEYAADWTDIQVIGVGFEHIVGVQSDGTVVAAGANDCGQCDISALWDHQYP